MENKACGMARDLMPLVIDEVASGASREWVESHVGACDACRAYMDDLRADAAPGDAQAAREERAAMDIAANQLKKKIHFRTLRHVLLGSLIALAVFVAGLYGVMDMKVPADLDAYAISFAELDDGTITFSADYKGSEIYLGATIRETLEIDSETGERKRVLYVGMERYILNNHMELLMRNGPILDITKKDLESFDEIRQGTKESYRVIWRAGEEVPRVSEEMEAYYFWTDLLEESRDKMIESADGELLFLNEADQSRHSLILQQMEAIRATVPEWQPWVGETPRPLDDATIEWLLESGENGE